MPKFLAIDLGSHAVKVTVLRSSGRRATLEGRYSLEVPQDGSFQPTMQHRLAALDALIDDYPELLQASLSEIAWPAEQAALHRIELPFADLKQVEKTLPFAVEAEVPFDLDDMVLGWRIVEQGEGTTVMVALARFEALNGLIEELQSRRLEPRHIYVDSEVVGVWAPTDGIHAIVDVGHTHTVVTVVRDGQVLTSRGVDVAGWHFSRAIQGALDCSWEEAERLKHGEPASSGQSDPDEEPTDPGLGLPRAVELPEKAREAVDAAMGLLLAEVRTTLIAAEDRYGVEVDQVLLTGGGSRMDPLASYLEQDLGVEVSAVVDLDGNMVPVSYTTADALALRASGLAPTDAIDMRTGDLAFRGGVDWLKAFVVYGGSGLVFFSVAAIAMFIFQTITLNSELDQVQSQIDEMLEQALPGENVSTTKEALSRLGQRASEADARAKALGAGGGGVPPTVDMLYELTQAFPPANEVTVDVTSLTMTVANISFDAETDSYASADLVEEAIQAHERFSNAQKDSNTQPVRDKKRFTINIPLVSEEDEGEEG